VVGGRRERPKGGGVAVRCGRARVKGGARRGRGRAAVGAGAGAGREGRVLRGAVSGGFYRPTVSGCWAAWVVGRHASPLCQLGPACFVPCWAGTMG
jgi:hypothetical protein